VIPGQNAVQVGLEDPWDWDDITPEVLTRLQGWDDRIQQLISAADAKASTLLGWSGTALALTSTLLVGIGPSWSGTHLLTSVLALAGVVLLGGCVVALILAIRPHLGGPPAYGSFVGAGGLDPDAVIRLTLKAGHPDPAGAAAHVVQLAHIATRKHQRIRAASTMLLAAFGPLILAAAVGVAS
jgi:Family of unknown function (DUF5706)